MRKPCGTRARRPCGFLRAVRDGLAQLVSHSDFGPPWATLAERGTSPRASLVHPGQPWPKVEGQSAPCRATASGLMTASFGPWCRVGLLRCKEVP